LVEVVVELLEEEEKMVDLVVEEVLKVDQLLLKALETPHHNHHHRVILEELVLRGTDQDQVVEAVVPVLLEIMLLILNVAMVE
tara:strand:- start:80 stop:328 length:249 start_codon:yes stop_codon:yes gene_type:complete